MVSPNADILITDYLGHVWILIIIIINNDYYNNYKKNDFINFS